MDDSNVHTSVVIELANQEETEDHKTYKIDFNEAETPKDYVIDQIFCGENITVYALFEIPEKNNKKPDDELIEIPSSSVNEEYRFIHKNSFKKTAEKKLNGCNKQIVVKDSEEDMYSLSNSRNRNKSFHCLKHLGENYEIPTGDESEKELKVLFKNNLISKNPKQTKFKAVSKGVNTDIAQSPKLIEEVQRAMTFNFSCGKNNEKTVEITSRNSSYEITDMNMRQSLSSYSSDAEVNKCNKKTSPDFLFVPLLMMEDKTMNHFRKEKNQTLQKEKILETKTPLTPDRVSLGTNTDLVEFSNPTFEKEERREIESSQCEVCQTTKNESNESNESNERNNEKGSRSPQSHLKKKDRDTILNEIKKLQGKLNALIKSIEYSDVYLTTYEDENVIEVEKETSKEVTEKVNNISQPLTPDLEPFQKNQNKFDEIPIFSPLTFSQKSTKSSNKKSMQNVSKSKNDLVKSVSSDVVPQQENISTVQSVSEEEKPKVKLKKVFSGFNINWELRQSWKNIGASKSDANIRCTFFLPKYNCIKKSMSFDIRDDKMEMFCLKKMKNSAFKFEGSLKANMRIIQNGEVHLGGDLASLTGEMGDEASRKLRISKTLLQNLTQDFVKEENISLKKSKQSIQKILNEEEGDAKLIYPKQSLISPNFVQNPAVLYCSANTIISDGLLKSVKNVNLGRGKCKTIRIDESSTKACSDPEKPTTSYKTYRKSSATDSELKKEVKAIKKLGTKNKNPEKKNEKKEAPPNEIIKPKFLSGCRKFAMKGTAESKLHVDKLIKKPGEIDSKHENGIATNNYKGVTRNAAEKQGGKSDKTIRPRSQKRDLRENTFEMSAVDRKITNKKSLTSLETELKIKSSESDVNKNVDQVMFFEKNAEVLEEKDPLENSAWLSSNSSSVVVELFSKKPTSVEEFYTEVSHEPLHFTNSINKPKKSDGNVMEAKANSESQEKPIVKSVWALTKVLLYEDGTKKLEVLEASLTPPGYCLQPKN